jgi:hypothetical protein
MPAHRLVLRARGTGVQVGASRFWVCRGTGKQAVREACMQDGRLTFRETFRPASVPAAGAANQ